VAISWSPASSSAAAFADFAAVFVPPEIFGAEGWFGFEALAPSGSAESVEWEAGKETQPAARSRADSIASRDRQVLLLVVDAM
jgi:hypothetical protein